MRTLSRPIMSENSCTNSNSFYLLENSSHSLSVLTCSYFKNTFLIYLVIWFPQLQPIHSFNQPFISSFIYVYSQYPVGCTKSCDKPAVLMNYMISVPKEFRAVLGAVISTQRGMREYTSESYRLFKIHTILSQKFLCIS